MYKKILDYFVYFENILCVSKIFLIQMRSKVGKHGNWRAFCLARWGFCHPAEAVFIPWNSRIDDSAEDNELFVASATDVRPDEKEFLVFLSASLTC